MLPGISDVFSFLRGGGNREGDSGEVQLQPPTVKVTTDRSAYRPGDHVVATVEAANGVNQDAEGAALSLDLVLESLVVVFKGLERFDPQWMSTRPPLPRSTQRRGERTILESPPTAIVTGVLLEHGAKKTYVVRILLPNVLPPSYKGTVVRYLYYVSVHLKWAPAYTENGLRPDVTTDMVDIRTTFNIWTMPNSSGLTSEEMQSKEYWGIVPKSPAQVEISWKEKDDEGDWIRAADVVSLTEEDYSSQTGSPVKGGLNRSFDNLLQLQNPVSSPRGVSRNSSSRRSEAPNEFLLKQPSVSTIASSEAPFDGLEDLKENSAFNSSGNNLYEKSSSTKNKFPFERPPKIQHLFSEVDDVHDTLIDAKNEHEHEQALGSPGSPSGQYIRGRSYNIKFDDRVLLRFSPKNSDLTYYFGDVVGGVLSFFHEDDGARRCVEVSAILETRECLNPSFLHPSRKNSPIITKVQAEYHEIVADMLQTHFIFTIPPDGPPSFATPQASVQWVLRFEFVAVGRNVDRSQYEHPLLIHAKEKGEWSLPLTVHAPLPRTQVRSRRKEKILLQKNDFWPSPSTPSGPKATPLTLP